MTLAKSENPARNPEYWTANAKPFKTRLQKAMIRVIEQDIETEFTRNNDGLNVVLLGGPNLEKSVSLYWPLLGRLGELHSAEIDDGIFTGCHLPQASKLPPAIKSRVFIHRADVFDVAKTVAKQPRDIAIELDFCNTAECQWEGSLYRLNDLIRCIHPKARRAYLSLTHAHAWRRKEVELLEFFLHHIPRRWEDNGWLCLQRLPKPYRDPKPSAENTGEARVGGFSMMTTFYIFSRRDQ